MIESHIEPSVAWTDAKQQVTSSSLRELIELLTLRHPEPKIPSVLDKVSELRKQIDKLDDQLIQKVSERIAIVDKIGEYKRDNNITILQLNRWDEVITKRASFGKALKLDESFTTKLLELIHAESIRKQTEI